MQYFLFNLGKNLAYMLLIKRFLLVLGLISATGVVSGQKVDLQFNGGYVFDNKIESPIASDYYYFARVMGGFQYGVSCSYLFPSSIGMELSYSGQNTELPMTILSDGVVVLNLRHNLGLHYVLGGGSYHYLTNDKLLDVSGTLLAGMLFAKLESSDKLYNANESGFAWGLKGGCSVWLSQRFALNFQAMLLTAPEIIGGEFTFGVNSNTGGKGEKTPVTQISGSGGIIFRLSGVK